MKKRSLMGLLAALFIVLAGAACGDSSSGGGALAGHEPEPIIFPVQDSSESKMEALLEGTLIEQGRCLYVSAQDPERLILPIWPDGFSYEDADGSISVLDAEGKTIAEVGSPVSMGGGISGGPEDAPLPSELRPRVESCNGPYWIVGEMTEPA